MGKRNYSSIKKFLVVGLALSLNLLFLPVSAAGITSVSDNMSRVQTSTASNHTITFTTPTGVTAAQNMTVTFPAGFNMGSVAFGDIDVSDNGTDLVLAGAPAGATWGAAVAGQVLTITSGSGTITAGHTVVIEIGTNATFGAAGVNQITNPGSANTYVISIAGSMADSGQLAVVTLTNDQIPVTAVVSPSLTFTVSNTTLDLGAMSTGSVATSSFNNVNIGTNAHNGYTIYVKDLGDGSNPGLNSAAAAHRIPSATATLAGGTEGYGANCNKVSASGACNFADGATQNVTGLTLAGSQFATYGSKPAATEQYQIRVKGAISATTEAGTYIDTLTVIGTANF